MSDLPDGWATARLDEIADVRLGRQRSPKNHTGARMRPYLRAANVTWAGLDVSDVKEMNFTEAESAIYELRPGDVLVAEASGSASEVGKPAIWRGEIKGCCFQNTLIRVRSPHTSPEFIRYFLLAEARSGRIGEASPGVGIHHIGAARLSAWNVPLPPLNEQRRIVAAIEEQFSRLDATQEPLLRADLMSIALRSAVITSLIDGPWAEHPWREIGRSQNGRAFPSRDYSTEGVKLLRPGNLHVSGRVVWSDENTRRMPTRYEAEHPGFIVGPGELVMNLTAQSLRDEFLGRICLTGPDEHCLLNQRLARLTPSEHLDPAFLLYVFKARPFRRFVNSLNKGSLIQHMFTSQLADFHVPVPPLEDQRRIVRRIDHQLSLIDATKDAIGTAQHRSQTLRRAILEQAFIGRLVPQTASEDSTGVVDHEAPATNTGEAAAEMST